MEVLCQQLQGLVDRLDGTTQIVPGPILTQVNLVHASDQANLAPPQLSQSGPLSCQAEETTSPVITQVASSASVSQGITTDQYFAAEDSSDEDNDDLLDDLATNILPTDDTLGGDTAYNSVGAVVKDSYGNLRYSAAFLLDSNSTC